MFRPLAWNCLAAAFHQKHVEVRGQRLGVKLPHHGCDLTSMVSGMVRHMLHEVRQPDLCGAKGEHSSQGFVRQPIHELDLLLSRFPPTLTALQPRQEMQAD